MPGSGASLIASMPTVWIFSDAGKSRLVQDDSEPALQTAAAVFEEQIKSGSKLYMAAGNYAGLALIALHRKDIAEAKTRLQQVKKRSARRRPDRVWH